MDADQPGYNQDVFYLPVVHHLWLTICDLLVYGVLAEYQKVYPGTGGKQVFK